MYKILIFSLSLLFLISGFGYSQGTRGDTRGRSGINMPDFDGNSDINPSFGNIQFISKVTKCKVDLQVVNDPHLYLQGGKIVCDPFVICKIKDNGKSQCELMKSNFNNIMGIGKGVKARQDTLSVDADYSTKKNVCNINLNVAIVDEGMKEDADKIFDNIKRMVYRYIDEASEYSGEISRNMDRGESRYNLGSNQASVEFSPSDVDTSFKYDYRNSAVKISLTGPKALCYSVEHLIDDIKSGRS